MDRPMFEGSESPQSPEASPESARRCGGTTVVKIVAGLAVALAVVVGAGYFVGVTLDGRGPASAAASGGTDEQRKAADTMVRSLSAQMALYQLQHLDAFPDFVKYPNWEQFTKFTDEKGQIVAATSAGRRGPYAPYVPENPFNGLSTVAVVTGPVRPGDAVPGGQKVGFVLDTNKTRVFVTDAAGTTVIDPAAVARVRADGPAPAAKRAEAAQVLRSVVQTARSQVALYRLQHNDADPDFAQYPAWEQMTDQTDERGVISRTGKYGPYFRDPPANPLHGGTRVQVVKQTPDASFKCTSKDVGFVFDTSAGKIYGLDFDGSVYTK